MKIVWWWLNGTEVRSIVIGSNSRCHSYVMMSRCHDVMHGGSRAGLLKVWRLALRLCQCKFLSCWSKLFPSAESFYLMWGERESVGEVVQVSVILKLVCRQQDQHSSNPLPSPPLTSPHLTTNILTGKLSQDTNIIHQRQIGPGCQHTPTTIPECLLLCITKFLH